MIQHRIISGERPEYWVGRSNVLIRFWTYIKVGLGQVNDFKYVGAAIFGAYYTLKLANPVWLIVMTAISLPILCVFGRWWLYKGAKTSEYVTTSQGSVLEYKPFNLQVDQVELLQAILDELKSKNDKSN